MTKNFPSLGFPEEEWDIDGDYFCRPHPSLAAAVMTSGGDCYVTINPYSEKWNSDDGGTRLYKCWMYGPDLIEREVDCPLQAQAVIQNYLDTNSLT